MFVYGLVTPNFNAFFFNEDDISVMVLIYKKYLLLLLGYLYFFVKLVFLVLIDLP